MTLHSSIQSTLRNPVFQVLFITAAIIVWISIPRLSQEGLSREESFRIKMQWHRSGNVVIAGDSRIFQAIAPKILAKAYPGQLIYNFAFDGVGYGKSYMDAISEILVSEGKRVVLLGITPRGLTHRQTQKNGFLQAQEDYYGPSKSNKNIGVISKTFDPISFKQIKAFLRGKESGGAVTVFKPDGWSATTHDSPDTRHGLKAYSKMFINNQVSPEVISGVIQQVRDWTSQGIEVIGFRAPVTQEMYVLENKESGFDEAGFIKEFQAAGGRWLAVEQGKYETYDGGHLQSPGALAFSAWLVEQILSTNNK